MDSIKFGEALGWAESSAREHITQQNLFLNSLEPVYTIGAKLMALPSVEHISSISIGASYDSAAPVSMYVSLSKEHPDSPILREIVKAGIVSKIEKSKHWDGKSLNAEFVVDGVKITISGYVPNTCRIEEEEVEEVVENIQQREDGAFVKKVKKRTIVCVEPVDATGPVGVVDDVPFE